MFVRTEEPCVTTSVCDREIYRLRRGGEGRREKKGRGSEGKRDRVRERETERRWVGACGRLETLVWFSQTEAERRSTAL